MTFRVTGSGSGHETEAQTGLSSLPANWSPGTSTPEGPAAFFAGPPALLGDPTVQGTVDSNPAGLAEAFRATAERSGTAGQVQLYLDASATASEVRVGLYSDASGQPGTLLAQATLSAPVAGAWNAAGLPPTSVSAGTDYWLAVLAPAGSGVVAFRDAGGSGAAGSAQTSAQTSLSSLPATWSPGTSYPSAPLSAYVVATSSPSTTSTSYGYDPAGNRLTKTVDGTPTSYSYDRADRLLSVGGTTYTLNANGNTTNRGSDSFTYDQANRLTSATIGGVTTTYTYDGDGVVRRDH